MVGAYGKRTRQSGLRGSSSKRRRSSTRATAKKAYWRNKYQRPTAYNQKRQIAYNLRTINRVARQVKRHLVYTDWKSQLDLGLDSASSGWSCHALMDPHSWTTCLRADEQMLTSNHTFVKRFVSNFRAFLGKADYAYFSLFVTTPRRWAADRNPVTTAPVHPYEYVDTAEGSNARLNSSIFKVVYARYITLSNDSLGETSTSGVGNAFTTYRKMQLSCNCKVPLTQPKVTGSPASWQDITADDIAYNDRYYLMCYITYSGASGTGDTKPYISVDTLFTLINSD